MRQFTGFLVIPVLVLPAAHRPARQWCRNPYLWKSLLLALVILWCVPFSLQWRSFLAHPVYKHIPRICQQLFSFSVVTFLVITSLYLHSYKDDFKVLFFKSQLSFKSWEYYPLVTSKTYMAKVQIFIFPSPFSHPLPNQPFLPVLHLWQPGKSLRSVFALPPSSCVGINHLPNPVEFISFDTCYMTEMNFIIFHILQFKSTKQDSSVCISNLPKQVRAGQNLGFKPNFFFITSNVHFSKLYHFYFHKVSHPCTLCNPLSSI